MRPWHERVAAIVARVARIVGRQGWGRRVVAAAPDLDLRLAIFFPRLLLVQSLQRAVVAFLEAPVALDRQPQPVQFLEDQPLRADRALEHRGVDDIGYRPGRCDFAARLARLFDALDREVDIRPAGKQVLEVPDALAMTNHQQFAGQGRSSHQHWARLRSASAPAIRAARSGAAMARSSRTVRSHCWPGAPSRSIQRSSEAPSPARSRSARVASAAWPSRQAVYRRSRATACQLPVVPSNRMASASQSMPSAAAVRKY